MEQKQLVDDGKVAEPDERNAKFFKTSLKKQPCKSVKKDARQYEEEFNG